MKKIYLLTCLFFVVWFNLNSQVKEFTLKECIEYAWAGNNDIRQSELSKQSTEIDFKQAKLNQLPNLNFSTGQNYQIGRNIDRFTNAFVTKDVFSNNFNLSSNVLLFNGLAVKNNILISKEINFSSNENLQAVKNNIALSIANVFLQLINSQENIKTIQLQIENTLSQLDRATKLEQAGISNQSITLSLKAQLANEKLNLINAQNLEQNSLIQLKTLMQFPFDNELKIKMNNLNLNIENIDENPANIYKKAVQNLPQIKSFQHQLKSAEIGVKLRKSNYFPTVSLGAFMGSVYSTNAINTLREEVIVPIGITQNTNEIVVGRFSNFKENGTIPFQTQIKDNLGYGFGLSLNWTIFDRINTINQVKKARINQQISELNLEKAKNTLYSEITTAFQQYTASKSRLTASEENMNAQKLNYEFLQKRFDAGLINAMEYTQAKNNYQIAQSQYLQSKYEMIFRFMVLQFYQNNQVNF